MAKPKNEAVSTVGVEESKEVVNGAQDKPADPVSGPVDDMPGLSLIPVVPQKATIGRTVIFKLSEQHAAEINRRRTTGYSIGERIKLNCNSQTLWPLGAQAHIGNEVHAGDEFPMTVVRVWSDYCVNGQVFLDGNDTYWATSVSHGEHNGMWQWPPMV